MAATQAMEQRADRVIDAVALFVEFACDQHWPVVTKDGATCCKCGRRLTSTAAVVLPFRRVA